MSTTLSAPALLGEGGCFASRLPGYEVRAGQLEVAAAVEGLLETDGVLLCEAGTGIGKTYAYLVPALLSGRKVVISTATRTLQDQIAGRDLPEVQRVLGTDVSVSVMKGLSNYLCWRRYREFLLSEEAARPKHARDLDSIRSWLSETETGDLAELALMEERSRVRLAVASSSETRVGSRCPHFNECFVTRMKRDAEAAQIVVVNHHLFFADLALRGPHAGRVLPDYDAVILDEAHQVEDIAAMFFGARLTSVQLERSFRETERVLRRLQPSGRLSVVADSREATSQLCSRLALRSGEGRRVLPTDLWRAEMRDAYLALDGRLEDLAAVLDDLATGTTDDLSASETLNQLARRALGHREMLTRIVEPDAGRVSWMDVSSGTVSLSSTPVDLSDMLREKLFASVPAVALMSATLSTAKSADKGFAFVRARLGLGDESPVQQLEVASPFDFEKACVLYLPEDLPTPGTPLFHEAAADRITELVELVDGGAFVLTTSLVSMRRLHALLVQRLPERTLWMQGQRPREILLSAFRAHGSGVLVATSSFWEGVDVPGAALRLVVLEKIPFAVPTDPVFQARGEALKQQGKSAFAHLALPGAAIALKQGFGRLVRRQDDVGVVALLDDRILRKPYGKRLLAALPPARRASRIEEVREAAEGWVNRQLRPDRG